MRLASCWHLKTINILGSQNIKNASLFAWGKPDFEDEGATHACGSSVSSKFAESAKTDHSTKSYAILEKVVKNSEVHMGQLKTKGTKRCQKDRRKSVSLTMHLFPKDISFNHDLQYLK